MSVRKIAALSTGYLRLGNVSLQFFEEGRPVPFQPISDAFGMRLSDVDEDLEKGVEQVLGRISVNRGRRLLGVSRT